MEFLDFYENSEDSIRKLLSFVKTFISLLLIYYLKNSNNILSKYLIELFHNYKIYGLKYKYNLPPVKDILLNIVTKRQWERLLEPKIINLFFILMDSQNDQLAELIEGRRSADRDGGRVKRLPERLCKARAVPGS